MDQADHILPGTRSRSGNAPDSASERSGPEAGDRTEIPLSRDAGDLYLRAGDLTQAISVFQELMRRTTTPDLGLARRLAFCHERMGRYHEAIQLLAPLLCKEGIADAADPQTRQDRGACHLVLGKSYLEVGHLAEAEAEGLIALSDLRGANTPEPGFVQNLLGTIAFRRGDVDSARTCFREALEHFRSRGDVVDLALSYINLGHLYKHCCEWDRALEHYQTAYYLRATEGEFQDQGAILQNLGLVLMKIGRTEEARAQLERSLGLALQLSDPVRAFRARLGLARLAREGLDLATAQEHLGLCRAVATDSVPEREACLLLLEDLHLARLEGRLAEAKSLLATLRDRVQRLASRGDLMIEVLLAEGSLALDEGTWGAAGAVFGEANELAVADRDRFLESRALFGQMEVAAQTGRVEEVDRLFQLLHSRHRHGGEQPSLARLLDWRGRLAQTLRGNPEEALALYTMTRDLWRRMEQPRLTALAELRLGETLLDLGRISEGAALVASVRERGKPDDVGIPLLAELLESLSARIRQAEEEQGRSALDGERALRRLEEILSSPQETEEKLREILALLADALAADGAVLARTSEGTLELAATLSMGRLNGRRTLPASALGMAEVNRAAVLTPPPTRLPDSSEAAGARSTVSWPASTHAAGGLPFTAMGLPTSLLGREYLLYLERRECGRGVYTRADLNYAMVLLADVSRALRQSSSAWTEEAALEGLSGVRRGIYLADVVTQNRSMLSILELIHKVSDSDLTVLLLGETGTGKRLLAQAIHKTSRRKDHPFVTVDCAALPDSLLESELFGHRKGAFTGAVQDRVGLLEEANGGTIFLDEIDKAGLPVQRRFLHMLDSGEIRPVGTTGYRRLDVRVVCATSRPNLRREVEEGRLLKDLYYRLNDISIVVPPLRERPDDIPLLAEVFVGNHSTAIGRRVRGMSSAFLGALCAHRWPGNVRELEKAIRRAVTLLDDGGILTPDLLPAEIAEAGAEEPGSASGSLKARLELYEKELVLEILDRTGWNKSRSAVELGLSRKGLKNKILRYGLERRRSRRS